MLSKKFTSIYQSFEITNCKGNLIDRVLSEKNKNLKFQCNLFSDVLSAQKSTNQYRTSTSCYYCSAKYAVDTDINTCMMTDDIGITSAFNHTAWWYVDLGGVYNVYNIRIQFKNYGQFSSKYTYPIEKNLIFIDSF